MEMNSGAKSDMKSQPCCSQLFSPWEAASSFLLVSCSNKLQQHQPPQPGNTSEGQLVDPNH